MEENRIMKAHLESPLCLTDAERRALAEIGHRLGNKRLKEVAYLAKPDTILGCIQTRTPGVPVYLGVLPGCVVTGSAGRLQRPDQLWSDGKGACVCHQFFYRGALPARLSSFWWICMGRRGDGRRTESPA